MRAFNLFWKRERGLRGGQCAVSDDGGDMGGDSGCWDQVASAKGMRVRHRYHSYRANHLRMSDDATTAARAALQELHRANNDPQMPVFTIIPDYQRFVC